MNPRRDSRPSALCSCLPRHHKPIHLAIALLLLMAHAAYGAPDPLKSGFENPPDSARPRVWWHWMNGNITREGIREDLQWMHRIGIGGVQTFDASEDTPRVVPKRLVFMTPPWENAFRYTTRLANDLTLELAIAGSPGSSESGGPWVKPEQSMKKLVWSEFEVTGGHPLSGKLPQPPSVIGPFQNVPVDRSDASDGGPAPVSPIPALYHDVAVLAYRLPEAEHTMAEWHPAVSSSAGPVKASLLWDGDLTRPVHLPYGEHGKPAWVQVDFGTPRTIRSMTLGLQDLSVTGPRYIAAVLESSSDGVTFQRVTTAYDAADDPVAMQPPLEETVSFAPVTARYFRLQLSTPSRNLSAWGDFIGAGPPDHRLTEFVLHACARVDHFEKKAAYFLDAGVMTHPTPAVPTAEAIAPDSILDLSARLRPDGTLSWTPPPGRWTILRLGYSLLGITNHPASPEGTGLEVDKLSGAAVKDHMDQYLARYQSFLGPQLLGAHGLRAMIIDSYEAGPQNWTETLPQEFARRRGYDLHRWMPALTGRIVGSASATDQFLWDFRRTLSELIAENHYGEIASSLHAHGMIEYSESHEGSRAFIGDGMDAKRSSDVPMGAMWMPGLPLRSQETGDADLRESASVAHIYGHNRVGAESMTAFGLPNTAYSFTPEVLKPTADRELADGLNLFVVHTSVHQPLDVPGPGVTLGPFGQWFTRHETWAEQAGPWVTYLARSSFLLQQGQFVADVLYYYGEDSNITALFGDQLPRIPVGYAFDFANTDALTQLSVTDHHLNTRSGMRYRVLALDPRARIMSLDVLKTIARLVQAGATAVGHKPLSTPSLADSKPEFDTLVSTLWGSTTREPHPYGSGQVFSSLTEAIAQLKIQPDFSYTKPSADTRVWFVHRHLNDGDLYFVNNREPRPEHIEASFRVTGKAPEIWHADTGHIEPASYRFAADRTVVSLRLEASDAVFVVFRKDTAQPSYSVPEAKRTTLATLDGTWELRFPVGQNAPSSTHLSRLTSWTASQDAGIRYFSGTASYRYPLSIPAARLKAQRIDLDLGTVKDLAEVLVNGQSIGILWKPPFQIDITDALRPGDNRLEIKVTNTWVNRLIGDQQPGAKPYAHATFDPYKADSPLHESGLLGPVTLVSARYP